MTLKEAIIKVITTQFKKDMGEAIEIVENAGYVIKKGDKTYMVVNPANGREVWVADNGYKGVRVHHGIYTGVARLAYEELDKFDFVNCLEKPENMEYRLYLGITYEPTRQKIERIRGRRWYVKYHADEIEAIKKKIAKLQDDLVYHTTRLANENRDYMELRKEFGLTK